MGPDPCAAWRGPPSLRVTLFLDPKKKKVQNALLDGNGLKTRNFHQHEKKKQERELSIPQGGELGVPELFKKKQKTYVYLCILSEPLPPIQQAEG